MNITLDKKSNTDGLITISLSENDYKPKVSEKLKEYSRKASIKGFRAGKVPTGVIQKMYGKSILVEEVNSVISHSISDYIKSNNLRILGDPLPNRDKAQSIDWDAQKDFDFEFQIGMVADFQYELSPKVKLRSYVIEVGNQEMDETLNDLKNRFARVTYPETSEVTDNIYGEISPVGSGNSKATVVSLSEIAESERQRFVGLTKGSELEFDINIAFPEKEAQARLLGTEHTASVSGNYIVKVTNIDRAAPAVVDQELFDKVFGTNVVTSEEDFIAKVKETISANYKRETEHLLEHEIQHFYVGHTDINMPDDFLKAWLKATSNGEVTDDVLDREFNEYKNSLKWDLIRNKIAEDLSIAVDAKEVKEKAKEIIVEQFGVPGIAGQLGDKFDAIADNYLSGKDGKGENFMKLYNQLRNGKIVAAIKAAATIEEKKVSLDEFKKIAAAHRH